MYLVFFYIQRDSIDRHVHENEQIAAFEEDWIGYREEFSQR